MIRAGLVLGLAVVASHSATHTQTFSCPRGIVTTQSDSPAVVESAALRLVPTAYAKLTSMGVPGWHDAVVVGVVSTAQRLYAPQPPLRGPALRLCGRAVADGSWAVFFEFPGCQIPCSQDTALIAHTRRGWVIWYSEYRRP